MKSNKLIGFFAVVIFIAALVFGYMLYLEKMNSENYFKKYIDADEKYKVTKKTLAGYVAFTSYSSLLTKTLTEQTKLISAKTRRQYAHFENIQQKLGPITSNANLELLYTVEYAIGYDLGSGKFKLESNEKGITLYLKKPEMVALPSVIESKVNILSSSLLINVKQASINLLNNLPQIANANNRTTEILQDEAVIALCEKKIKEFIRNLLVNQHNAEIIPEITITYF